MSHVHDPMGTGMTTYSKEQAETQFRLAMTALNDAADKILRLENIVGKDPWIQNATGELDEVWYTIFNARNLWRLNQENNPDWDEET